VLRAIKERGDLDTHLVDDIVLGCVIPLARRAATSPRGGAHCRLWQPCAGRSDQSFLCSGLDAINFAAAQIMAAT